MGRTTNIIVYGKPRGKQRPRTISRGNKTWTYTPKATAEVEEMWIGSFLESGTLSYGDKPIKVTICAYFKRPKKCENKYSMTFPDYDNLAKLVTDALQGLAFDNDKQIVEAHIYKMYCAEGESARTEIEIVEKEE